MYSVERGGWAEGNVWDFLYRVRYALRGDDVKKWDMKWAAEQVMIQDILVLESHQISIRGKLTYQFHVNLGTKGS